MKLLIEPQCWGFEHAQVNAAFVELYLKAFNNEELFLVGEYTHLDSISKIKNLEKNVEKMAIKIPNRKSTGYNRFYNELKLVNKIFSLAQNKKIKEIIFLSITSEGLLALKWIAKKFSYIKVTVIPHSILETIIKRPSLRKPWELPFWFKFTFLYCNQNNIKYLVLGDYIEKYLNGKFPRMNKYIKSIHLPYFYNEESPFEPFKDEKVRFGFIGVGHKNKGAHLFFNLAKYICEEKKLNAEFYLIGHLVDKNIEKYRNDYVKVCSKSSLSQLEYDNYISKMDYTVFLYNQNSYKLIASGAILDAFSHVKPILCLKNSMFDFYFKKNPNIGNEFENFNILKQGLENIINEKDKNQYEKKICALKELRETINIDNLSKQIKLIVEGNK